MEFEPQPAMDATESALAAGMRTAAEALRLPGTELAAGGLARGRRLRRVRRVQLAGLAAAVLVAAVTTTTAVASGAGRPTDGPAGVAAAGDPMPSPSARGPLTSANLAEAMPGLLPEGATGRWQPAPSGGDEVGASALLRDAKGSGRSVVIVRASAPGELPLVCPDLAGTAATCTVSRLPDGSTLRLDQNFEYPATKSTQGGKAGPRGRGAKVWSATLARPDGILVYLEATDSSASKHGRATRPAPILTLDQLTAVVTDPAWQTLLAALPPEITRR
jgi:hypothetical protein